MFESLPGFREFYPEQCALRNRFFQFWRQAALRFGFSEYDAPVLESLDLYRLKSGDEIVSQLYAFADRGGREVALRPEMTPSLARMVGARASSLKRPIKWFSIGEQYRYERPQRGRLRAFYQFNADILGETAPEADAELIALLVHCFTVFGLTSDDFYVRVSDRELWFFYLRELGIESEEEIGGVLSVIDKVEREPEEVTLEKLRPFFGQRAADLWARISSFRQIKTIEGIEEAFAGFAKREETGQAIAGRLNDWRRLLDAFGAMELSEFIEIDLGVVRGLAYYTGFVFEAFDRKGALRALAGGGRYDKLLGRLSRAELPAAGFGIGDVTLFELLSDRGLLPDPVDAPALFIVAAGNGDERSTALKDATLLRQAGYRVEYPLRPVAFGKQFKLAGQSGARYALIYGEEEVKGNNVKVRDLNNGAELIVPRAQLITRVGELF